MMWQQILMLVSWWVWPVSPYKILVMASSPMASHNIAARAAADIFYHHGHNVTFVTAYSSTKREYTEIIIPEISAMHEKLNLGFDSENVNIIEGLKNFTQIILPKIIDIIVNHNDVKLLEKGAKFDLIVIDFFYNEPLLGFAVKFDCPAIIISSLPMMTSMVSWTNNILQPAIIPNNLSPYNNQMTFLERSISSFLYLTEYLVDYFLVQSSHEKSYRKNFPNESLRVKYNELSDKIALTLVNSHPVLNYPQSLFPNAKEIGGYHVGEANSLPKDLQNILDNAKNGVIYFSLGSNLKSAKLDIDLRQSIMKAFSSVKYTILWKFEEDLIEKPENVIIRKWMPQTSILAHKNMKLFISHGGLLSIIEAIYFGVPMVSIPKILDHPKNANAAQLRGFSITLEYSNITAESLTWAIQEAIGNPNYKQAALKTNRLFFDSPMSPRDSVNYYAEYAIRTNGSKHLHPPKLSFYQFYLLDVVLVFVILPSMLLIILCSYLYENFKRKVSMTKVKTN